MKYFYGILCIIGIALPCGVFIPWLVENGVNILKLFSDALSTRISIFAWLDVIISAVVLIGFIAVEGKRLKIKHWWLAIIGTLSVGVSLGLPLFLLLREIQLEKNTITRPSNRLR